MASFPTCFKFHPRFQPEEEVCLCAQESPKSNLSLGKTGNRSVQLLWEAELSSWATANGLQLSNPSNKVLGGSLAR